MIKEILKKYHFDQDSDRLGPDCPFTHWKLYIKSSMLTLGKNVIIRPNYMLFADPRPAEDDFMIGSDVHMYVHNHRFDDPDRPIIQQGHYDSKEILIKCGAWIGAKSIILPGVMVGENCIIGARSVVTHTLPDRTLAVGVPAKVIRKIDSKKRADNDL